MSKKITDSTKGILKGVDKLGDAVGSTLGALGHTVFIQSDYGPVITKDGYEVSTHVASPCPEEQLAIDVVRQATQQTADGAGDGTTTSTVLAQAIINQAHNSDYAAAKVVIGVKEAADKVLTGLKKQMKVLDDDTMYDIANVSTNNDSKLATLITDVFKKCGKFGGVTFKEDPNATETRAEHKASSILPLGFSKPAMINNIDSKLCLLDNPLVVVSNAKFRNIHEVAVFTDYAIANDRDLLIIGDTSDEIDETLIFNRTQKQFNSCVLKPHQFTDPVILKDVAALVNATYFDEYSVEDKSLLTTDYLGEMERVEVGEFETIFTVAKPGDVEDRKEMLRDKIDNGGLSEMKRRDLEERLGILSSSFGTIYVAAPTQAERMEIFRRVEDAVKAIGTAKRYGYLPGGGVALRDVANGIKGRKVDNGIDFGFNAVIESISEPYYKILENAGLEDIAHKKGVGTNVLTGKIGNMVKLGIIDPAGVTSQAFVNAVSASVAILGTKMVITKLNEGSDEDTK